MNEWSNNGTWERVWRAFLSQLDSQDKLDWAQAFLDGSFVSTQKGATEYIDLLDPTVTISMSATGQPTENGLIKRFIRTF